MICAWCKKEIDSPYEYTPEKEPLCSEECTNKCHFGLARGMVSEKVSNLTKEQRRLVSEKYHEMVQFNGAMRSVEKQQLQKTYQRFQYGINFFLFISVLAILGLVKDWIYSGNFYILAFLVLFAGCFAFMSMCMEKTEWFLKFRQLYKESGADLHYDSK